MTYPIAESFLTGTPGSFASVNSGNIAAAYNSAAQAVDVTAGTGNTCSYWLLDAAQPSTDFHIEFDLELVSDPSNRKHFGLGLATGTGFESYRISTLDAERFSVPVFSNTGVEIFTKDHAATPWAPRLGNRGVWRLDYIRTGALGRMVFSLDGAIILQTLDTTWQAVRPGVFSYGCTVRVHSVSGDTGSAYPYVPPGAAGFAECLLHSSNGAQGSQPGPPNARGFEFALARRNHWQSGNGRVRGTVVEKGTPDNPVHRKVRLFHERSGLLVGEVWSDGVTGAYDFINVDSQSVYTTISYDHTGAFRAVVANGQVPEMLP